MSWIVSLSSGTQVLRIFVLHSTLVLDCWMKTLTTITKWYLMYCKVSSTRFGPTRVSKVSIKSVSSSNVASGKDWKGMILLRFNTFLLAIWIGKYGKTMDNNHGNWGCAIKQPNWRVFKPSPSQSLLVQPSWPYKQWDVKSKISQIKLQGFTSRLKIWHVHNWDRIGAQSWTPLHPFLPMLFGFESFFVYHVEASVLSWGYPFQNHSTMGVSMK